MAIDEHNPSGMDGGPVAVTVDGKEYEFDRPAVTGREIEEKAGIPRKDGLIRVLDDGTQEQVGEDERIDLKPGDQFRTPSRFVRGEEDAETPDARRRREMEQLRARYPQLEYDESGLGWFRIRNFRLPPGWNRETTDLLVMLPPEYPMVPPGRFFVKPGLRLASSNAAAGGYSESTRELDEEWAWFGCSVDGWDPIYSLETFMGVIERSLRELS